MLISISDLITRRLDTKCVKEKSMAIWAPVYLKSIRVVWKKESQRNNQQTPLTIFEISA